MNRLVSFSLALALILSGVGGIAFIRSHQQLGRPGVKVVDIPLVDTNGVKISSQSVWLPKRVLDFTSVNGFMSKDELDILPKDTTFGRRLYTNAEGFFFQTSVILMGKDRTSIHRPEYCLANQGWRIARAEIVPVRVDRPYPYDLPVMKLTASQNDPSGRPMSALYLYWFVSDKDLTAEHGQRLWSIIRNLLREGVLERWAYASYFTVCEPGTEDAACQKLSRVIAASAPEFQLVAGSRALTAATRGEASR